jgi:hypothetical protein
MEPSFTFSKMSLVRSMSPLNRASQSNIDVRPEVIILDLTMPVRELAHLGVQGWLRFEDRRRSEIV